MKNNSAHILVGSLSKRVMLTLRCQVSPYLALLVTLGLAQPRTQDGGHDEVAKDLGLCSRVHVGSSGDDWHMNHRIDTDNKNARVIPHNPMAALEKCGC